MKKVYLFKGERWSIVPHPKRLPKGEYYLRGPFNFSKANFLMKIYNLLPFTFLSFVWQKKSFIFVQKGDPKTKEKRPGLLRPLYSAEDWNYGDYVFCGISGIRWRCLRCGSFNVDTEKCPLCQRKTCRVCLDCYQINPIRSCQLYLWQTPTYSRPTIVKPLIPFSLTKGQIQAQKELSDLLQKGKKKLLLHAACGAGKTEVAATLMAQTLASGGRVLYAVPRRDVAIEVGERLRQYFPSFATVILYGGSKEKYSSERIVAATTHQVLKFYQAFDLTILDEGDAFPFKDNSLLINAVNKATRGSLVYMTATPTKSIKAQFKKEDIVFLPARHHKKPLPIPQICKASLESVLKKVSPPLLLFVPFKRDVDKMVVFLQKELPQWKIKGISSETKERSQLVRYIKCGTIDALVSTSVLERGITVDDVSVLVYNADYEKIYTKEVLVQIAGRAGRTTEHPDGLVIFIAKKVTKAMKDAQKEIISLNEMAKNRGEIDILC